MQRNEGEYVYFNLPGPRRASPSSYRRVPPSASASPRMQQTYRYNDWNSNQYGAWDRQFSNPSLGQNAYLSTNGVGSALSIDAGSSELTPLPRARNKNDLHPRSQSTSEGRFWTPQTETSPERKANKFSGKELYNKFLVSFRKKKGPQEAVPESNPTASTRVTSRNANNGNAAKPPKPVTEKVTARVLLLDGEEVSLKLSKKAFGMELIRRICDGQDIIETDYFGITYTDKKLGTWFWLDFDKKIIKQVPSVTDWQFYFQVKFYPPEPTMLQDETTRYQLVLQVRQDVYTGKLPCSWVTQALLGSFHVQSELGDYDPDSMGPGINYLRQFEFVRNPTDQLLQKIMELHMTHKGMKPGQADIKYLETAKRLDLYGLDLHPARDMENVEIYIGVGYSGIVIYRDRVRIGRFAWPKVLRISYKKSYFYLKIRPDYTEQEEAVVGFALLNPQLAKRLWKTAVEHHAFFRLKGPRVAKKGPLELLSGSSRFQYSGRTFFQYRTAQIDRPADMPEDEIMYDENGQPKHHRTASVPAALNRAGIRYDSIHSLNRTHPRDMTIGKAQSSDYLGPTKQRTHEPIRNVHSVNQPIITATRPPPPRLPVSARPPQPQPTSRRIQPQQVQQPISGQNYFENDGSLFDGASSRGEGSIIGSGFRGAEYEVPRQLSANDFSSYAQEQENLSIMSGDGADDINDPGVVSVSSVPWSASNSYNPRPSQESWMPSNPAPSVPPSASYLPHARDELLHYVNVGDNNGYSETSSEIQNAPTRPNRKSGPYVRQNYSNDPPAISDEDFL